MKPPFQATVTHLIMKNRLLQLALLLQNRGEIAVRGGELRVDLERLQIQPRRLLDLPLLSFDVRQIVL